MQQTTRSTILPRPRRALPRLSALLVSPEVSHRRSWMSHLRGVGIGKVYEAVGPQDAIARGRLASEHGVCIVEGAPQEGAVMQTTRELRRVGWDRMVLVTPKRDEQTVRLALAAKIRNLVVAVAANAAGKTPMPRRGGGSDSLELSEREIQVVQLVANGHTNRSVGEELNLSALTVKSHLSRIGRKLGTGDRAQIVATCMRAGIIG